MMKKIYYVEFTNGEIRPVEAGYFQEAMNQAIELSGIMGYEVDTIKEKEEVDSEFLEFVNSSFKKAATGQELKGISKYGVPLNPMSDYDWLNMAEEEQIDGYKYLVAEREKRDKTLQAVLNIIDILKEDHPESISHFTFMENLLKSLSKNLN